MHLWLCPQRQASGGKRRLARLPHRSGQNEHIRPCDVLLAQLALADGEVALRRQGTHEVVRKADRNPQ